jgi:hypothetical protein
MRTLLCRYCRRNVLYTFVCRKCTRQLIEFELGPLHARPRPQSTSKFLSRSARATSFTEQQCSTDADYHNLTYVGQAVCQQSASLGQALCRAKTCVSVRASSSHLIQSSHLAKASRHMLNGFARCLATATPSSATRPTHRRRSCPPPPRTARPVISASSMTVCRPPAWHRGRRLLNRGPQTLRPATNLWVSVACHPHPAAVPAPSGSPPVVAEATTSSSTVGPSIRSLTSSSVVDTGEPQPLTTSSSRTRTVLTVANGSGSPPAQVALAPEPVPSLTIVTVSAVFASYLTSMM